MDSSLALEVADVLDPHPDIHALFCYYNSLYFEDALGACVLTWSSKRMTLCAGVCCYDVGGSCEIRLSEPLLKFRSSADLKNTLLHEMIHAYLWIKNNNKDHSDHGPNFQNMMNEINASSVADSHRPHGGYKISIFHNFSDEVESYRVHHWACQSCGDLIKRAMNRKPSPSDCVLKAGNGKFCGNTSCHWHEHKMRCDGEYQKVAEPPEYRDKKRGSKGNIGCHGEKSEASIGRGAQRRARGTKSHTEADFHKKTIENFYPIMSDANKNAAENSPSGEDHQNQFETDCSHEPDPAVSTCAISSSEQKSIDDERLVGNSDAHQSNIAGNSNPASDDSQAMENAPSSDPDHQNSLNPFHRGSTEETRLEAATVQKTDVQRNHKLRTKKRKRTPAGGNAFRKTEDYTVIIKWKDWYAIEEEEDVEALHNKRAERRLKQRLAKNTASVVPETKEMGDASHSRDESGDVLLLHLISDHNREDEEGACMGNGNGGVQSAVFVVDDVEENRAGLDDSINDCQDNAPACENISHPATSQGLAGVSSDCGISGFTGREIDIIDLSDG